MVIDGKGRYLGDPAGKQYFMLSLEPGTHTFVAWAENADMMQATLAPGRVYYVLLSVRMGVWSARMSISALTPRREEWQNLKRWLDTSKQMVGDTAASNAWLRDNAAYVRKRMASAKEAWGVYKPKDREVRILRPEDGFAAPAR